MLEPKIIDDTIILSLLEAASVHAGKEDLRRYLNAVLIRNVGTSCHIVAADGHRMMFCIIDDYQTTLPERITTKSIKDAVKVRNISLLAECNDTKNDNYPDYLRLIPEPKDKTESLPALNALYLADMGSAYLKAFKKIHGKGRFAGLSVEQMDDNNGNLFLGQIASNITIKFIIMPMRR